MLNSKDLNNSGSSGPLWLGDWKYQIGSSKKKLHNEMKKIITI